MNELRNFAATIRAHTKRVLKPQTVAEHSYHVAMLCWKLCDREPSAELLKAALFHDLAESYTGDVPANVKWASPTIKAELERLEGEFEKEHHLYLPLRPEDEKILKWADALELMWYCVDEMNLGNRFVDDMYSNINNHMDTLPPIKNGIGELFKVRTAYAIARTRR
jgi:5'-deoxynucleotidase YfbR-like HD superfamily hydrolase